MDGEKLGTIHQLRNRFPALSVSEARSLLETHNWNLVIATAAAEQREKQKSSASADKYFVGGGAKGSGQQVIAPGEGAQPHGGDGEGIESVINNIFRKAAEEGKKENAEDSDTGGRVFFGRGQRLGYTANPSPFIASTVREERTICITIYHNGFEVEDQFFIPLDSEEGRGFVEAMDKGYVPASLASRYPNTDLTVNLRDCLQIDYTPPAYTAFQGEGHRLTSTSAAAASSSSAVGGASPTTSGSASATPCYNDSRVVELSDGAESSFVVLVNTRGERQQVAVNPSLHTVEDLYTLAHRYQPSLSNFVLVVRDMPPRRLEATTRSQTIEAAKLKRCVVALQQL